MAVRNTTLGGTDFTEEGVTAADLNDTFDAIAGNLGYLGEVRMFALSETGAVTKATLQAAGWAICDGTTPAAQGISSPTMTAATPDLQHKFIRMSDDESSGSTGGEDTHTLTVAETPAHTHTYNAYAADGGAATGADAGSGGLQGTPSTSSVGSGDAHNNLPSYHELAFFMRVRVATS